ncbi:MAG: RsmB/NOP family class I SAM-dependent RNA methyltransferase [Nakamurella multipartita]
MPPHAAVSSTVELVRAGDRAGAAGYVNAVLRRIAEADLDTWVQRLAPPAEQDRLGHLAMATAHPRWIVSALADRLAPDSNTSWPPPRHTTASNTDTDTATDELEKALRADDVPPTVHLVARPGLIGRDELVTASGGTPAQYSPYGVYLHGTDPGRVSAVADGRAAVQDEGRNWWRRRWPPPPWTDPTSGGWTRPAGPGAKAGLLGAFAAGRGAHLDAVEIGPHRADLVRRTTAGLPVTVHTADGRASGLDEDAYDRVLLDAPCTGLGALRRRPESRWRRPPSDVTELVELQQELLAAAARHVRVGGLIAYVTCSPHLAETLGVVGRRPDQLELCDARPFLPGVPALGDGPTVQLWPHRQGTDGMFLALLRRTG